MNKTKRVGLSTIAAFAMAACTFATLGMANGISANAEAVEPTPAEEGIYLVEYETKAPSFTVTNLETGDVVYPVAL